MAKRKPTPKKGRSGRSVDWRRAFLAAFRDTGNVRLACEAAKIDRSTAYARRKSDAEFLKDWEQALEDAADTLEKEARRRAYHGWDEPHFGSLGPGEGSGQVGVVRKYSDTLLIFLLKGARPDKFRDNAKVDVNHTGSAQVHVYLPAKDGQATPPTS